MDPSGPTEYTEQTLDADTQVGASALAKMILHYIYIRTGATIMKLRQQKVVLMMEMGRVVICLRNLIWLTGLGEKVWNTVGQIV